MTNPTVEEAMERLRRISHRWHSVQPDGFDCPHCGDTEALATIRKHIEDQDEAIDHLVEALSVERAAALVTIEELTEERDGAEATERDAWKQVEEQERTIDYLERRIEELQRRIKRLQERFMVGVIAGCWTP